MAPPHTIFMAAGSKDRPRFAWYQEDILSGCCVFFDTLSTKSYAKEMWTAIERLQQGESLNVQDVKTNLFWEFRKFTSRDGESIESYYSWFYKLMNDFDQGILASFTMQVNVQFPSTTSTRPCYMAKILGGHTEESSYISLAIGKQVDQNVAECVDERAALANLIANLTLDTEENKTILKQLKKQRIIDSRLKECKTNLDEFIYCIPNPTAKTMEVLIKTLLMPLSNKTILDSHCFVHELKREMNDDLEYVNSLEKELDELESEKADFSNIYDLLLEECVSKDVTCSYLHSLSESNAHTELKCMYLHKVKECECLALKLSKQTESVNKEVHNNLLKSFSKLEKHSIFLELPLQQCKQQMKNNSVSKETGSNVFLKEREQYHEIQDLKAQMQDKNIAISELKKLIEKCKGKSVETQFDKPSVVRQPNAQRSQNRHSNSRTSNANAVCAECGTCVFNSNHDACVSRYLKDVNARTKKPNVVPISASKPKRKANKSVATPHKKTVASDTTIQKSKSYYKELYENTNQEWKWWIAKRCPSGYTWTQKPLRTKKIWMPKIRKADESTSISPTIDIIVQLILFIVDSGCTKHMTGNLKLLCNFVEKFLGTVRFGNDQFAPILGYGDLIQGNVMIKWVYYVEGLNHNLFSGNDFTNGSRVASESLLKLYLQDKILSSTPTVSWLLKLHQLKHGYGNEDFLILTSITITVLSKKDVWR
ncbi:hypothetical protein Tco_1134805 [Tanacetum coccineum]